MFRLKKEDINRYHNDLVDYIMNEIEMDYETYDQMFDTHSNKEFSVRDMIEELSENMNKDPNTGKNYSEGIQRLFEKITPRLYDDLF